VHDAIGSLIDLRQTGPRHIGGAWLLPHLQLYKHGQPLVGESRYPVMRKGKQ
jgi:hypothetical protein